MAYAFPHAARGVAFASVVVALALPDGLFGQDAGRVLGTVMDRASGEPLTGVLVLLDDGQETETDETGIFLFPRVPAGEYRIAAVSRGCRKVTGAIDVVPGADKLLKLVLDMPAPTSTFAGGEGASLQVIRGDELRPEDGLSALDILRRRAPDLVRTGPDGYERLGSRGRNSIQGNDEPILIVDGTRVREQVARALDGIAAADLQRLEISRGAAGGWMYGMDAGRGVVRVVTLSGADSDPERPPRSCGFVFEEG